MEFLVKMRMRRRETGRQIDQYILDRIEFLVKRETDLPRIRNGLGMRDFSGLLDQLHGWEET